MRILSAIFAALLWTSAVWAVDLTTEDETAIANRIASSLSQYNSGDYEALLDAMPPSAVTLFGGRDQMKASLERSLQMQKQKNIVVESMTPGKITKPFMAGTTTICFVPTESVMKVGDKRVRSVGFMVASRAQGESEWRLLEGSGLAKMPELLAVIFPGAPEKADLPPIKNEVLP